MCNKYYHLLSRDKIIVNLNHLPVNCNQLILITMAGGKINTGAITHVMMNLANYKDKIILLDLNYTLVENSKGVYPYTKELIEGESYRLWLVQALKQNKVIIITVRNKQWQELTLRCLYDATQWQPDDSYFPVHFEQGSAPSTKLKGLQSYVFPKYGNEPEKYLALESNPRTRAMYTELGIEACSQEGFRDILST